MKNKNLITSLLIVLALGIGFFLGTKYQATKSTNFTQTSRFLAGNNNSRNIESRFG